jgi:hypothetical protein
MPVIAHIGAEGGTQDAAGQRADIRACHEVGASEIW